MFDILFIIVCALSAPVTYLLGVEIPSRLDERRAIANQQDPWVQAEIDQTPEWWDREFRRLSGEPEPVKWGSALEREMAKMAALVDVRLKVAEEVKKSYSPSVWKEIQAPTVSEIRPYNIYYPEEGERYELRYPGESRSKRVAEFFLSYPEIDYKNISADGWDRQGYDYMLDEWEYEEDVTFCNGESVLVPTCRVREWREWPEGFDYEGLVKAWNGR